MNFSAVLTEGDEAVKTVMDHFNEPYSPEYKSVFVQKDTEGKQLIAVTKYTKEEILSGGVGFELELGILGYL